MSLLLKKLLFYKYSLIFAQCWSNRMLNIEKFVGNKWILRSLQL